jgi:hypothetical protein
LHVAEIELQIMTVERNTIVYDLKQGFEIGKIKASTVV